MDDRQKSVPLLTPNGWSHSISVMANVNDRYYHYPVEAKGNGRV